MALFTSSRLVQRAVRIATQSKRSSFDVASSAAATSSIAQRQTAFRPFTTSSPAFKKRKIAPASNSPPSRSSAPSNASSSSNASGSSSSGSYSPEDPLDFSALKAAYSPIDTHFKSQFQTVLHGGRFNPNALGALPVTVKPESGSADATSFPLRELAQVVPRSGRTISLLVHDREYIKPIMSAVQSSPEFNQQPQRSEDNDLELLLRVELERKDELVKRVKEAAQGWRDRVRQARTKHDKLLKEWKKTGAVLPDVVKRAEKELQKVQDTKMKEIDGEEAQTIKGLER